jgi:cyclopropane fatty-acyl-phospholipid synthase-like methyltransferase
MLNVTVPEMTAPARAGRGQTPTLSIGKRASLGLNRLALSLKSVEGLLNRQVFPNGHLPSPHSIERDDVAGLSELHVLDARHNKGRRARILEETPERFLREIDGFRV